MSSPPGVSNGALAKELIGPETRSEIEELRSPGIHFQAASPRPRVRLWRKGGETVRAASAFAAGEALRKLGVPGTSGVVALFAAGFYPKVTELLVRLSQLPNGSWPALAYYVSLEYWMFRWVVNIDFDPGEGIVGGYDPDDENIVKARLIAQSAIDNSTSIAASAWEASDGGSGCDLWTKKAIHVADFESEVDSAESFSLAWGALKSWARRLYRKCGGKPGYPLYTEVFRLSDYATPPLEFVTSLMPKTSAPRNRQKG